MVASVLNTAASFALFSLAAAQPLNFPQYVLVNKAMGSTRPLSWNQGDPSSVTQASFDDILNNTLHNRGTVTRMLGVSVPVSVLLGNQNVTSAFLANVLSLSQANNLPVSIALDAFEWWNDHPELWNWWNASAPGYDPANVANVEYDGWPTDAASNATTIAWRDWGRQFRVPAPHPNIASPAVLAAAMAAFRPFITQLVQWYNALPSNAQYLLASVKIGWEVAISTNYYYYADGNSYRTQDPSGDPTKGITASVQLGYASVCTAGIACSGTLTSAALDAVVSTYLTSLAGMAYAAGIPRNRLFTHVGADMGGNGGLPTDNVYNTAVAAFNEYSMPGMSMYAYAYNPFLAGGGTIPTLSSLAGTPWACSEWYYEGGNSGTAVQQWFQAFNNSLSLLNAHMVVVYNWESLVQDADALTALQSILSAGPCVVDAATSLQTQVVSSSALLIWTPGQAVSSQVLDVSNVPAMTASGTLANAYMTVNVTGNNFTLSNLLGGTYFWTVRSFGCTLQGSASGAQEQQMVSAVQSFVIS